LRIRHRSSKSRPAQQLPGFAWLKDDGTTSCGNWIYCGSFTEAGNQTPGAIRRTPPIWAYIPDGAVLAGESPRALQPRVVRADGKPGIIAKNKSGGTESAQKWVATTSRTSGRFQAQGSYGARSS